MLPPVGGGKPTIVMDPYSRIFLPPYRDVENSTYGLDAETVIVSSVTDEAHDHVAMVRNGAADDQRAGRRDGED